VLTAEAEPADRFGREKFSAGLRLDFSLLLSAALMVLAVSLVADVNLTRRWAQGEGGSMYMVCSSLVTGR